MWGVSDVRPRPARMGYLRPLRSAVSAEHAARRNGGGQPAQEQGVRQLLRPRSSAELPWENICIRSTSCARPKTGRTRSACDAVHAHIHRSGEHAVISDTTCSVYGTLLRKISGVRMFGRSKQPDMYVPSVNLDTRAPFLRRDLKINSEKTTAAAFLRTALVLQIERARHRSEIVDAVVGSDTVNMIDVLRRPDTVYVKPSKAVFVNFATVYVDKAVSVLACTGSTAFFGGPPASLSPREYTRLRVVVQQFVQTFRRQWDNVFAHAACPPDKGLGSYLRGLPAPEVATLYARGAS